MILESFIDPDTQQRAVGLLPELELSHCFQLEDFADAVATKRTDPRALKILIKPRRFVGR